MCIKMPITFDTPITPIRVTVCPSPDAELAVLKALNAPDYYYLTAGKQVRTRHDNNSNMS